MKNNNWLQRRRETIQKLRWLRPAMWIIDLLLVITSIFFAPVWGIFIGIVGILLNEIFSPIVVQRIFCKEFQAVAKGVSSLEKEVTRKQDRNE